MGCRGTTYANADSADFSGAVNCALARAAGVPKKLRVLLPRRSLAGHGKRFFLRVA